MHHERILVLGATGHYGQGIVRALCRSEASVRVLTRDGERARALFGPGVEVAEGDVTSHEAVSRALEGSTAVVSALSAFSPGLVRRFVAIERDAVLRLFEELPRHGIRRLVYLSVYDLRKDLIERFDALAGKVKLEVESALAASALDWTVLGCAPSMQLFFRFIRGSRMLVPGGGPPAVPTVGSEDVGVIAAQCVRRTDMARQRLRVTGPEALGFAEAAERIGKVWGRRIKVLKLPLAGPRLAAAITAPFNPFMKHVVATLRMLNAFPQEIAAEVPSDHARLRTLFDYVPKTLEDEARATRGDAGPGSS